MDDALKTIMADESIPLDIRKAKALAYIDEKLKELDQKFAEDKAKLEAEAMEKIAKAEADYEAQLQAIENA